MNPDQQYYEGGQEHYFGGGSADSSIHPAMLAVLIAVTVLVLFLPRKYAIYPFVLGAILVPGWQIIVVAGVHLQPLRVLVGAGCIRMLKAAIQSKRELRLNRWNKLDKTVVLWVFSALVTFTILWGQWGAFTSKLGEFYNYLGIYFLLRFLIQNDDDIEAAVKALALACLVCGFLMLSEQFIGHKVYGIFGGTRVSLEMREGRPRSQACFAHPLLAGSFGGTLIPLFVGAWYKRRSARRVAALGVIGGLLMAVTSNCSTSLTAVTSGILALCLWPLRRSMRVLRWSLVIALTVVHLAMKAPVWALIARIDLTGGSSGYHRYQLIDQAIHHFWDWWLVGTTTQATWGWDMWDSIDWYVNEGTSGGLVTLILFVAIIVYAFKRVGSARNLAHMERDRRQEFFVWSIGAVLFANALAFIGIAYYDQTIVMWFVLLTIISGLRVVTTNRARVKVQGTFAASDYHVLASANEQL
jgi:hypothetical protein